MNNEVYIGVDIGSATVKIAGISNTGNFIGESVYLRHDNFSTQVEAVKSALNSYLKSITDNKVMGIGITGSGRELNKHLLGGDITCTEIFAHSVGIQYLLKLGLVKKNINGKEEIVKDVGSVIEIGGQDSKVIVFDKNNTPCYFNMNTICSAGTGEFLKQIADEAGISLEEFGQLALCAKESATIDSTCTVFSKRDFRHLTQKGVPLSERLAGICDALVNNYLNNVVKNHNLTKPIFFQGGVAFNEGVKKAFERRLNEEVLVSPCNDIIGALGMASIVKDFMDNNIDKTSAFKKDFGSKEFSSRIRYCHGCQNNCELCQPYEKNGNEINVLDTLGGRCEGSFVDKNVHDKPKTLNNIFIPVNREYKSNNIEIKQRDIRKRSSCGKLFVGFDGGSRGTKYALIRGNEKDFDVLNVGVLETSGDAIKAIINAIKDLQLKIPVNESVSGIGTTGSAGELARDIVTRKTKKTSDIKATEIIAHITWAKHMVPNVRTIMDIGGNDAKIIVVNNDSVDFAMNDKCAAGAGAFVEAIANRFEIPIEKFGDIALESTSPARISGRCAVFGESDIIHKSRSGFPVQDLFMGLAYSLCRTYLSDIGKGKVLSTPIVAQGGTFLNHAIQKAFKEVLQLSDDELILADDTRYVIGAGALGAAILAKEEYEKGFDTAFKGFDYILNSKYDTKTVACNNPVCKRTCNGLITLMENNLPIAGYKSIDCDFGLYAGMVQDGTSIDNTQQKLEKGFA